MNEETTFSEELMKETHWKDWIKEHRLYLLMIGVLSLISLGLWVQDRLRTNPPIPQIPLPVQRSTATVRRAFKLHPPQKILSDPISQARTLAQASKLDEAISVLLNVAQSHPDLDTRVEASQLAKTFYQLRSQRKRHEKNYLEAYVLFETYPNQACDIWKTLAHIDDMADVWIQKSISRFNNQCKN